MLYNYQITVINQDRSKQIVDRYRQNLEEDLGLFLVNIGGETWEAIDNSEGACYIEEFDNYDDAVRYLMGDEEVMVKLGY
ncbi:hypothetical protein E4665_06790 [Sporolactobacillus shoreae]|uniref:Uncharacterized protein n=1 Tax=Sporolactobacillus shoreae TaxID=1465501 RepID=A0A4Z0GQJ4_9BACL|nr:hypothetical protein [Sporolactobacillus shoreae]TGA99019.1 hypothetical protein E4665_06790 [Sporolactobacillus shoreae]